MNVSFPWGKFSKNISNTSSLGHKLLKQHSQLLNSLVQKYPFSIRLCHVPVNYSFNKNTSFQWPDTTLGFIGFCDIRFPLPGYIGLIDIVFPQENIVDKCAKMDNATMTNLITNSIQSEHQINAINDNEVILVSTHVESSDANFDYSYGANEKMVSNAANAFKQLNIKILKDIKPIKINIRSKTNNKISHPISVIQDILKYVLPAERHIQTLFHAKALIDYSWRQDIFQKLSTHQDFVQCTVYDCPNLVKRDFCTIFPSIILNSQAYLTAIDIVFHINTPQKFTKEELKEDIKECFSLYMNHLCSQFHLAGYWADFIQSTDVSNLSNDDPSIIPASDVITSDMYKKYGFSVSDGPTCKVIQHRNEIKDGTCFYGTLFTTAPYYSSLIKVILKKRVK